MMRPKTHNHSDEAEVTALQALAFLAADSERLQRFMDLSGLDLAAIRTGANEPAFLGGILDHLLADESLLLVFAADHQLKPERIADLRRKLPGAAVDF